MTFERIMRVAWFLLALAAVWVVYRHFNPPGLSPESRRLLMGQ